MSAAAGLGRYVCRRCRWALAEAWKAAGKRLCAAPRAYSSASGEEDNDSPSVIRNVGIMAHIDAGKTTTTERMLYYAGLTRRMGDVDDGDTVMDFLKQERERGITINSAAITFHWHGHRINLIDTPGHVDFMFEVERSLRVLDGAVALFDGSAGVEAQSISVWRQADRYCIPRIAFVNKMDKPKASLSLTVESMREKLGVTPLVTQLPVGEGREFRGVVDLVKMEVMVWERGSDGETFTRVPLAEGEGEWGDLHSLSERIPGLPIGEQDVEKALEARNTLVEQVATLDEELLEVVLGSSVDVVSIPGELLAAGLRRLTLEGAAVPVLCGSALRNTAVQLLMDAIITYLPSPEDRECYVPEALRDLCAFVFKVTHNARRGSLVFLRVYSGHLKPHSSLFNLTRNTKERVTRLLLVQADELREISSMAVGNIAVAVGMKNTYTGDTIVQSAAAARAAQKEWEEMVRKRGEEERGGWREDSLAMPGVKVPPPVFRCTVEPASAAQQGALEHALDCLTKEDPSLRVSTDADTGQTVLSGMGELHLEVVHGRLRGDFKVDCALGRLQVAYREAPTIEAVQTATMERVLGGGRQSVTVTVRVWPEEGQSEPQKQCVAMATGDKEEEVLEAVWSGIENACVQGPLLGFPVRDVGVRVEEMEMGSGTSLAMLASCVTEAVSKALSKADVQLLEPYTQLEVTVPEAHLGVVLSDLTSQRRAQVQEVGTHEECRLISTLTPIATLMGYSTMLRTLTSGTGSFSSTVSHYEPVSRTLEKSIVAELRGY